MILLLGLGGFFIPLVSFVAWYLGSKEKKEARQANLSEDSMVNVGYLLGIVGSVLQILSIRIS